MTGKEIADKVAAILVHIAAIAEEHPELVTAVVQIVQAAAKSEAH